MILTLKYRHLMTGEETAPVVSLDGVPAFFSCYAHISRVQCVLLGALGSPNTYPSKIGYKKEKLGEISKV